MAGTIDAQQVKELRGKTGAAMMECKTALVEAKGDMVAAEAALKQRGFAIAKKREERPVDQGRVFGVFTEDAAVLVELRCETDFVSENALFVELGERCAAEAHRGRLTASNAEIEKLIVDAVARLREKIAVNSIYTLEAGAKGYLAGYIHDIGRHAALIRLQLSSEEARSDVRVETLAADLALHVTAFAPRFLSPEQIDPAYREEYEREYREEASASGKPSALWEKIVAGKWHKHLAEVCLTEQPYLRDEDITVSQAVASVAREVGADIRISDFAHVVIAPAICR